MAILLLMTSPLPDVTTSTSLTASIWAMFQKWPTIFWTISRTNVKRNYQIQWLVISIVKIFAVGEVKMFSSGIHAPPGRVRVGARLFFIGAPTRTDRYGDPWFSSDEAKHLLQIPDQTKPTRRTIIFISNPPTQTKQKYFHQRYLNTLKYVSNSIIICME